MTNEDRLRSRLKALDDVGPSPGLLERARHSGPRQPAAGPSVSRRLTVMVTAFAVFGASAILVWQAFDPMRKPNEGPISTGTAQPPEWVVREAIRMATVNQDPNPTSAYWLLTDARTIAPYVGLSPDQVDAHSQEYLIVLHGSFTAQAKYPSGRGLTGSVLTFTLASYPSRANDWSVNDNSAGIPGLQPFTLGAPATSIAGVRLLITSSGPNGNQALITGRLDSTGGCLSLNGEILLWPSGYGLSEHGGTVWVVDDSGTPVTKVGDSLHLGGSATDLSVANRIVPGGVPASCSATQAPAPDPYWLVGQIGVSTSSPLSSVAPTAPPATQAPLSAQIVLPSNTMTAGSSISGQVIVVNNTGRAIHGGDCGTPFAIRLVNDTVKASVGWPACLQSFTVPKGQSSWPVTVFATYPGCGGGTRPCVGGRPPSLPPGYYRATLFQAPHVVPRPAPITILVTP